MFQSQHLQAFGDQAVVHKVPMRCGACSKSQPPEPHKIDPSRDCAETSRIIRIGGRQLTQGMFYFFPPKQYMKEVRIPCRPRINRP